MPLDPKLSDQEQMRELLTAYKTTGKIGNTTPRNPSHAQQIAAAIVSRLRDPRAK